jgi:hypothetical protein
MTHIGEEILPKHSENLVVLNHPWYFQTRPDDFPYDRNPKSTAHIPYGKGTIYAAGGLNGGRARKYLKFIKKANHNTNKDLKNGIIAKWHDESHLNKYILNKKVKILDPGYMYPDFLILPFERKIRLISKYKFGGYNALRRQTLTKKDKILKIIKIISYPLLITIFNLFIIINNKLYKK